jgi:hypothetical protein
MSTYVCATLPYLLWNMRKRTCQQCVYQQTYPVGVLYFCAPVDLQAVVVDGSHDIYVTSTTHQQHDAKALCGPQMEAGPGWSCLRHAAITGNQLVVVAGVLLLERLEAAGQGGGHVGGAVHAGIPGMGHVP